MIPTGGFLRKVVVGLSVVPFLFLLFDPTLNLGAIPAASLVALPLALWLGLELVWRRWPPDRPTEVRLWVALWGALSGLLLASAYATLVADSHFQCTGVDNREDNQCVEGDTVAGPDVRSGLGKVVIAGIAFYFSVYALREPLAD